MDVPGVLHLTRVLEGEGLGRGHPLEMEENTQCLKDLGAPKELSGETTILKSTDKEDDPHLIIIIDVGEEAIAEGGEVNDPREAERVKIQR